MAVKKIKPSVFTEGFPKPYSKGSSCRVFLNNYKLSPVSIPSCILHFHELIEQPLLLFAFSVFGEITAHRQNTSATMPIAIP